jgi:hypothetical protein
VAKAADIDNASNDADIPPPPVPGTADALDPALVALPAPPRARRVVAFSMMMATIVASLALLGTLRGDLRYFFSEARAVDLGEATAVDAAALAGDTFVRVRGTPMGSRTVHFQRMLGGETYALFPLAGQRAIFVQVRADDLDAERRNARREWSGRLVSFGQLGARMGSVRGYLRDSLDLPVTSETYVVLADEPPGAYGWSLVMALVCLAFVLANVAMMVRFFKSISVSAAAEAKKA